MNNHSQEFEPIIKKCKSGKRCGGNWSRFGEQNTMSNMCDSFRVPCRLTGIWDQSEIKSICNPCWETLL